MNSPLHISRITWISLLVCLAVFLFSVLSRDLWTPDEPRVAAIALQMSESGNLVVPLLADVPFIEKPPLYFAMAAAFLRVFGPIVGNTGAIRLASFFLGLGAIWMTFLLARRLTDKKTAILAAIVFATMAGSIREFWWIRVDIALIFFTVAAVWSFAEVYFNDRPWLLVLGGLFSGGAFLTKGFIGPVMVAIAWLAMFIPWIVVRRRGAEKSTIFVGRHLLCLTAFLAVAGVWMVLLRTVGGPELWHEWFWVNHVGRVLGTADKGHMHEGNLAPLYYFQTVLVNSLPWSPLILLWLFRTARDFYQKRTLSREEIFLIAWSLGSILLLTLSVTKRNVYLMPMFPALAIMCARTVGVELPRWCKGYFIVWCGLCAFALLLIAVSPFLAERILEKAVVKPQVAEFAKSFTFGHFLCFAGSLVCLFLIFRPGKLALLDRSIIATAILCIGFFMVPAKILDLEKSMEDEVVAFAAKIPAGKRAGIAAWGFSETLQGVFYYYGGWKVAIIEDEDEDKEIERVRGIVDGKNSRYQGVIIYQEKNVPKILRDLPYRIIEEGKVGTSDQKKRDYKGKLQWVEGL